MINRDYQVENGLNRDDCRVNPGYIYTYNQGVILSALIEMSSELKEPGYIKLAENIALAAIEKSSYNNGILKEPNEPDLNGDATQFKGIFMRHLGYLYTVTENDTFKRFIINNSRSLWETARNEKNEFGAIWKGPFDKADASRQGSALDCFNAAMVVSNEN